MNRTARPVHRLRPAAIAITAVTAVTAVLTLGGCSPTDDGRSEGEDGAVAAAQAYVDAIAALDAETADAMTDPEAFAHAGTDDDIDIREALPAAVDPIADPWVSLVSPTHEARYGATEYVIEVSYELKGLTGGANIVLALEEDADPAELDSWTVTDPLIVRGATYADPQAVPVARIGTVELTYRSEHRGVWGYPGGYLLTPATPTPDVDPLWLAVGAADAPPWNDSLPMLEPRGEE